VRADEKLAAFLELEVAGSNIRLSRTQKSGDA